MIFGKQKFYCNACGRRLHIEYTRLVGREWKVCSLDCHAAIEYARAASILGIDSDPSLDAERAGVR